jgi:asparagine synthase (glutamine-hydrolysing)
MARQASGRVRTFSIGFSEDEYDESTVAREVAAALGTEHTDLILDPKVESTFESIVSMFDEPFSDSSAIPTFLVAQLARQSVTVSLSGDGGDELFGGYSRYREVLGQTPLGMFGRFLGALGLMMPHAVPGRNKLVDFGRSRLGRYARTVLEPLRQDEGGVALPTDPVTRLGVEELLRDYFREECGEDFASAMMLIDLETYLPGDILTKVDRTSMAVSLEARVPLLDLDLVEFSLSIPGQQRVNRAGTKQLFRRVIKGMVPDIVLSQPKRGFEIPLGRWFRGPLRGRLEALRSPSEKLQEFVCVKALNRLVGEHAGGRRDHSNMLWRLMVLERWLGGFARGDLANPPSIPKL